MDTISLCLLRGICQIPAYVAHDKGFFRDAGIDAHLNIEPTAWMVPEKLLSGRAHFAVIPWTRVAAAAQDEARMVLVAGSGCEEAAMVLRAGVAPSAVRRIAIPQRGGIKDLTAMGLIDSLGWQDAELVRLPSGDGAIIALFGRGADAASMVEPFATMLSSLGAGTVIRRTGDLWPGAPGCSLTTTAALRDRAPELVQRVVSAFVRGADYALEHRDEAAELSARYIGVGALFVRQALEVNRPDVNAIRNREAMDGILSLMTSLGYVERRPEGYCDLRFLDAATAR